MTLGFDSTGEDASSSFNSSSRSQPLLHQETKVYHLPDVSLHFEDKR